MAIRIFVGTDERMEKAERVLEYSVRQNTEASVEFVWMRAGDPGFDDWDIGREPGRPYSGRGWATDFTCFRFAVPELAGFEGKAIYLDADMLVLGDVADLALHVNRRPWACVGGRFDVCVIECDDASLREALPSIRDMKTGGFSIDDYRKFVRPFVDPSIPSEWDDQDRLKPTTKLLHYTNMRTHPWKPWPEVFDYGAREHRDPKAVRLFWDTYDEATLPGTRSRSGR